MEENLQQNHQMDKGILEDKQMKPVKLNTTTSTTTTQKPQKSSIVLREEKKNVSFLDSFF